MSVLLLRFAAPLQSWGEASRYTTRRSRNHPTKSAVVGLLAAAQGRLRGADLSDLAALRFGVRVDQPGQMLVDFHTVSGASHAPLDARRQRLPTAGGSPLAADRSTKVTRRCYLADAVFVTGLDGDITLLRHLAKALQRPRYPLFFGRRSCPPSRPILLHLHEGGGLESALRHAPWQAAAHERRRNISATLDLIIEDTDGNDMVADQPLPSPPFDRSFATRPVRHQTVALIPETGMPSHDPFAALRDLD
jgi:CRISPR system Cascade subunit CasD